MTKCTFGFHDYNPWEIHQIHKFTSRHTHGNIEAMQRVTQKRTCKNCGKTFFESEEIHIGYGKSK